MSWVEEELRTATEMLQNAGLGFSVRVFVTADSSFVEGSTTENQPPVTLPQSLEDIQVRYPAADESSKSSTTADEKSAPPTYKAKTDAAVLQAGRPDIHTVIAEAQERASTEIGVAVCGPLGMTAATRRAVTRLETGDKGIYLHAESFGF